MKWQFESADDSFLDARTIFVNPSSNIVSLVEDLGTRIVIPQVVSLADGSTPFAGDGSQVVHQNHQNDVSTYSVHVGSKQSIKIKNPSQHALTCFWFQRSSVQRTCFPRTSALAPKTAGSSRVLIDSGTVLKKEVPMVLGVAQSHRLMQKIVIVNNKNGKHGQF